MLETIEIENFKCFGQKASIPLAPITLIYGENSAGKSTILQAMTLMRNTLSELTLLRDRDGGIRFPDEENKEEEKIRFSSRYDRIISDINDLIHDGETGKPISISLLRDGRIIAARFNCRANNVIKLGEVALSVNGRDLARLFCQYKHGHHWVLNWPLLEDWVRRIYDELFRCKDDVVEGYKRLIEHVVISRYLNSLSPGGFFRKDNYEGPWDELSMMSAVIHKEHRDEFEPDTYAGKWREGLPEWVRTGFPGYSEYVKSSDYSKAYEWAENKYSKAIALYSSNLSFDDFCNLHFPLTSSLNDNRLDDAILASTVPEMEIVVKEHIGDADFPELNYAYLCPMLIPSKQLCSAASFLGPIERPSLNYSGGVLTSAVGLLFRSNAASEIAALTNRNIFSLAALREPPKESYLEKDASSEMSLNPVVIDRINRWLELFGVDYKIYAGPGNSLQFVDSRRETEHAAKITEVGFGFSQLLPIVMNCCRRQPSVITIEQPELHIHPGLQAELGGLFASAYKEQGHQIIAETHSEHLMLRLQKLIRNKTLAPKDVCVLYVSRGRGKDGSRVQQLRLDDDGAFIDRWPKGFFPERTNEIMD